MPFHDFDVYWVIAQGILRGVDPYTLPDVFYPLPFYFLFLPLAALPLPIAHIVWTIVEAIIFVAIVKRRAAVTALFMPVLLTFLMGQSLMPMLGLFALLRSGVHGGIALALLMLKPQLVLVLAPWQLWRWWRTERVQLVWFLGLGLLLALSAFAVEPNWVGRWTAASGPRLRTALSPSLWGVLSFLPQPVWMVTAGAATIILVLWVWRRNDFDLVTAVGFLVNPVVISYDLTLFTIMIRDARTWILLTVLSWATFAASALLLNEAAVSLLTLFVIAALLKPRPTQGRLALEEDTHV